MKPGTFTSAEPHGAGVAGCPDVWPFKQTASILFDKKNGSILKSIL